MLLVQKLCFGQVPLSFKDHKAHLRVIEFFVLTEFDETLGGDFGFCHNMWHWVGGKQLKILRDVI